MHLNLEPYRYDGNGHFDLERLPTKVQSDAYDKTQATTQLKANQLKLAQLQDKFYAQNRESILLIIQAMDAAGKDSTIKHVMNGLNPQGITVSNFKEPTIKELDHTYLWRAMQVLPRYGEMAIFNRSYYEDVLVVKVHNLTNHSTVPLICEDSDDIFHCRYRQIRDFEKYLHENGTKVIKIFLHVSKEEQKQRFLERIERPEKNWKFSLSDIKERAHWDEYQSAYQDAITNTATKSAPWYIVPADKKWFTRLLISEILLQTLQEIDPQYPALDPTLAKALDKARKSLLDEKS